MDKLPMTKLCPIFAAILVLLSASCTSPGQYNRLLTQADSLVQDYPDSALHLLERQPADRLHTKADRAYYALLLTQARDKNYMVQTDDSLIRTAVHYYNAHKDAAMQARAYYLWGSVCRDQNKQAEAVEKYLQAVPFARKAGDLGLLGRIYDNVGYIYYYQKFYEKADSIYRLVEQIGIQLKDTFLWISSLTVQGEIQLYQRNYSQAEKELLQALYISTNFGQNEIKSGLHSALSTLYVRTGEKWKALQHAKQNFLLQKDTMHCYRTFLELGDAYFQVGQYDSATLYIRKSIASSGYATKAGAYMRLADIAKEQGDIHLSLEMERLHSAYNDSLESSSQSNEVIRTDQQMAERQLQLQYQSFLNKYRNYILILIVVAIVLIGMLHRNYQKRNQKQLEIEEKLRLKHLRQQHLLKEKEKEKEISELQQQIAHHRNDEQHLHALQCELKELEDQRTTLIKEKLDFTTVNEKIHQILSDYKCKKYSKEALTDDEWARLLAEVDSKGVIGKLCHKYELSKEEMHLCGLLLLDYSAIQIGHILRYERQTVYRKEQKILKAMGMTYKADELRKVLKRLIPDVSME